MVGGRTDAVWMIDRRTDGGRMNRCCMTEAMDMMPVPYLKN